MLEIHQSGRKPSIYQSLEFVAEMKILAEMKSKIAEKIGMHTFFYEN